MLIGLFFVTLPDIKLAFCYLQVKNINNKYLSIKFLNEAMSVKTTNYTFINNIHSAISENINFKCTMKRRKDEISLLECQLPPAL